MNPMNKVLSALFFSLFVASTVYGQEATSPQVEAIASKVTPFVDKSTIVVAQFDLKKLDPELSVKTLREIVDGSLSKAGLDENAKALIEPMLMQGITAMETEFKEGQIGQLIQSGCEEVFVVVNSMTMAQSPARVLFSFGESASANMDVLVEKLSQANPGAAFEKKDNFLVVDTFQPQLSESEQADAKKYVAGLDKKRKPQLRSEFVEGLERTKTAPLKVVFAPDMALKGMIQMGLGMAPENVREALPSKTVLDGAKWVSLGVDLNRWIIDLNVKGNSTEATQALYDGLIKAKDSSLSPDLAALPEEAQSQIKEQLKAVDAQVMMFMPKVKEDRLQLTIDKKFLDTNFPALVQMGMSAAQAAMQQMMESGLGE